MSMRIKPPQITLVVIFCIWIIVRCLPFLLFYGLYGFDAWYHLGIVLGISENNEIPLVNPYNYPYYNHAGLHIFTILINNLTGQPVIISLQMITVVIAILTFLSFYTLFRFLLRIEWLVLSTLLILALIPDFLVQTITPIPEAFALVYMPLAFLLILKLIRDPPKILSTSLCLGVLIIFLHFSHHWTNLLFFTGCLALLFGALTIRPQNLKTAVLVTIIPALFSLSLLLLDPFTANLFRIYAPLILLLVLFLVVSIIIVSSKGLTIFNRITVMGSKIKIEIFFLFGLITSVAILLIILRFYPIARPLLWQIFRFAPLATCAGLAFVSFFYILNIQRTNRISAIFLVGWLILLSLMFISGFILTLYDPASWYILTTLATITHRLFTYIAIAAAPLAAIGVMLIIYGSKQVLKSRTSHWKKSLGFAVIGLISCSLFLGVWNVYFPAGGWHQPAYTQTEIQAAQWVSGVRNEPSITYLDARLRWLFYGVVPNLPSNHSHAILDPNSNLNQIDDWGEFFVYFFVSDILEQQFMLDFSTPPLQIQIRPILDSDPRFVQFFSNAGVNCYTLSKG